MKEKEAQKNRVRLGQEDIIYMEIFGDVNENVFEIFEEAIEMAKRFSGKTKALLSFEKPLASLEGGSERRKKLVEMTKKAYKDPGFEKLAICGLSTLIRIAAYFVVKATKLDNIRVFESKKEALKWLKEP